MTSGCGSVRRPSSVNGSKGVVVPLQYATCRRKPTLLPSASFVVPEEILANTRDPHEPGPAARMENPPNGADAVTAPAPTTRHTNARVPPFSKNPFTA